MSADWIQKDNGMLPITFFLCGSMTIFHSRGLSTYYLHPPPPKMIVIHTLRFCLCLMNNEIWKVHLLSMPLKNLPEGSKFCRLLGRKTGIPLYENLPSLGWGDNRTSHCPFIFTFDHQVFLHSAKLCPTPPAASPHNCWAMLRLHKSNLMISPANNKPGR